MRKLLSMKCRIAQGRIELIRFEEQAGRLRDLPNAADLHEKPPVGPAQFVGAAQAPEELLGAIEQPPPLLPVHQPGQQPKKHDDDGQHDQAGNDQSRRELRMVGLEIAPHFAPFVDLSQAAE